MRIERETLINIIESVLPGTSKKDIVEQSSCVVFADDRVLTFNDELACTMPLPTDFKLTGAVVADPLLDLLRKLPDEVLDVSVSDAGDALIIKGKGRRAELKMEAEVLLPIANVDAPDKWHRVPPLLVEALEICYNCATTGNDSGFMLTCLNLTPTHVEACDNHQLARYPVELPIEAPTLIRRDSVKYIKALDVVDMGCTKVWLHFKTPTGLKLSCRRYPDDFPDLTNLLAVPDTSPTDLPPGLAEACTRAEVFSKEDVDNNEVTVKLKGNMVEITGKGVSGTFKERKQIKYAGPAVSFKIAPSLLTALVERHHEAEVSDTRLVVDNGKFRYVTCLGTVS